MVRRVRMYMRQRNQYQEVFTEVRRILVDSFGIDPRDVKPKTALATLKADGVGEFELMTEAEYHFGIEIEEEELGFFFLHDLVEHVAQLRYHDLNQT